MKIFISILLVINFLYAEGISHESRRINGNVFSLGFKVSQIDDIGIVLLFNESNLFQIKSTTYYYGKSYDQQRLYPKNGKNHLIFLLYNIPYPGLFGGKWEFNYILYANKNEFTRWEGYGRDDSAGLKFVNVYSFTQERSGQIVSIKHERISNTIFKDMVNNLEMGLNSALKNGGKPVLKNIYLVSQFFNRSVHDILNDLYHKYESKYTSKYQIKHLFCNNLFRTSLNSLRTKIEKSVGWRINKYEKSKNIKQLQKISSKLSSSYPYKNKLDDLIANLSIQKYKKSKNLAQLRLLSQKFGTKSYMQKYNLPETIRSIQKELEDKFHKALSLRNVKKAKKYIELGLLKTPVYQDTKSIYQIIKSIHNLEKKHGVKINVDILNPSHKITIEKNNLTIGTMETSGNSVKGSCKYQKKYESKNIYDVAKYLVNNCKKSGFDCTLEKDKKVCYAIKDYAGYGIIKALESKVGYKEYLWSAWTNEGIILDEYGTRKEMNDVLKRYQNYKRHKDDAKK